MESHKNQTSNSFDVTMPNRAKLFSDTDRLKNILTVVNLYV